MTSNTFYHCYAIQTEILKVKKLVRNFRTQKAQNEKKRFNNDRFGDICQTIVQHDILLSKNIFLGKIQSKGTHGHDLVGSKTYEVKGLISIFDIKGHQRRIKFSRDKIPSSDVFVVVLFELVFGVCHLLYLPMTHINNWFISNPNKTILNKSIGYFIQLANQFGRRRNYQCPVTSQTNWIIKENMKNAR